MKLNGKLYPNLIRKRSGFYWNAPSTARPQFGSISLGKDLDFEAYHRAQAALERWRKECRTGNAAGGSRHSTVDWLIAEYQEHRWFKSRLAEKTRVDYRNKLAAMANFRLLNGSRFGELPWRDVEPEETDKLFEMMCRAESGRLRETYARATMHTARLVWNWAKRYQRKEYSHNPWEGMRLPVPDPRQVTWTHDQLLRFIRQAEEMGLVSVGLAAVFCYELGQRPGDARKMCRSMFEDEGIIVFEQGKTGKRMVLPVSPPLRASVAMVPAGRDELVVSERTGRLYEDYKLSKIAAEIREAAKLPSHLWLADLRRTCINNLARLGASDDELISVSGHTQRQMLSVYSVREYEKALRVMRRLWDARDAA